VSNQYTGSQTGRFTANLPPLEYAPRLRERVTTMEVDGIDSAMHHWDCRYTVVPRAIAQVIEDHPAPVARCPICTGQSYGEPDTQMIWKAGDPVLRF
jgi:hypothetical protein